MRRPVEWAVLGGTPGSAPSIRPSGRRPGSTGLGVVRSVAHLSEFKED
jgi:hypothetical protein